jgi:hypothetical protein
MFDAPAPRYRLRAFYRLRLMRDNAEFRRHAAAALLAPPAPAMPATPATPYYADSMRHIIYFIFAAAFATPADAADFDYVMSSPMPPPIPSSILMLFRHVDVILILLFFKSYFSILPILSPRLL